MKHYLYVIELSSYYLDKMLKKIDNGYYVYKVMLKKTLKPVNYIIKKGETDEIIYQF